MEALSPRKKMGLTFAPEAGSDRMRRVINKQLTEQEILETFAEVFRKGWLEHQTVLHGRATYRNKRGHRGNRTTGG